MSKSQAQANALAKVCQKACTTLTDKDAQTLATYLLSHFDLVPAGVGKAIVAGYSKWMSKTDLSGSSNGSINSSSSSDSGSGGDTPGEAPPAGSEDYDGRAI